MMLASTQKDKVCLRIYESREEMGAVAAKEAAERIAAVIAEKGEAVLVFAAAPSQNEFLAFLGEEKVDWPRVTAFHMDEYIGLSEDAPQGFGNFLRRAIFDKKPFGKIHYIAKSGETPESICASYTALLSQQIPDIVFLGIGENGHLAFNDPAEADFNDEKLVKIVQLDLVCRQQQVNDGCFGALADVPKQAVTLTIPMLMRIPHALCIVPGPAKAQALYQTMHGPISVECPASILRTKEGAQIFTDRAGGAQIL